MIGDFPNSEAKKGDDGCELIAPPMGGKKGTFENEMEIKEGGLDETTLREKGENFPSGWATNDPISMVKKENDTV